MVVMVVHKFLNLARRQFARETLVRVRIPNENKTLYYTRERFIR